MKKAWLDNAFERSICSNPFFLWVSHMLEFQFERSAMINIVSNVLLIGEHLMDSASIPCATKVSEHAPTIQRFGDFSFALPIIDKCLINPLDYFDLLIRPGNQNHTIRLKTFVLPHL